MVRVLAQDEVRALRVFVVVRLLTPCLGLEDLGDPRVEEAVGVLAGRDGLLGRSRGVREVADGRRAGTTGAPDFGSGEGYREGKKRS